MKWDYLFRLLLIGFLLNLNLGVGWADYLTLGEWISVANFGRITASESVSNQLILPKTLRVEEGTGLTLLTENLGLVDATSGRVIPWERITLLSKTNQWKLRPNLEDNLINASEAEELTFTLKLLVSPEDGSGDYEGIFFLQPWQKSNNGIEKLKRMKVLVKLVVAPWVKLDYQKMQIELDEVDLKQFSLGNAIPCSLRVASNTKWAVNLGLNEPLPVPINLKIGSQPNLYQGLPQIFQGDSTTMKRIVIGSPTVTSKAYWVEIPMSFQVEGYFKIPAGRYQFQFICGGEVLFE